jgi:nucleoside 2-deoxyribosyltransferase
MKKVYYAHSMHLYNTKQEERDIKTLEELGFEVFNPNSGTIQEEVEKYKLEFGDASTMEYFKLLVQNCDIFVFRAHPNGKIPSGVGFELNYAMELGKLIIELPSLLSTRHLSLADTREYLKLLGQR